MKQIIMIFKYSDPKIGEIKASRGKMHEYLGMCLDYSKKGQITIEMKDYVKNMIEEFPTKLKPTEIATTPSNDNLFKIDKSKKLNNNRKEQFHTMVAKALFLPK